MRPDPSLLLSGCLVTLLSPCSPLSPLSPLLTHTNMQYPFAFEFNTHLLKTMMDACYNCQYGTFLCNTESERKSELRRKTVSFWTLVNSNNAPFLNPLYRHTREVLRPCTAMRDLVFWDEYYLRGWVGFPGTPSRVFPRQRFTEEVKAILREKEERIIELERQLAVYNPGVSCVCGVSLCVCFYN